MTTADKNNLRIFERRIFRKIFGPIKNENNKYRIRFNHELLDFMKKQNIVKFIKAPRLRRAEYMECMGEERAPKNKNGI